MKNIFWVINKEKAYAYMVSLITIVILFFMSATMKNNVLTKETSTDVKEEIILNSNNSENSNVINIQETSTGETGLVSNENMFMENNAK